MATNINRQTKYFEQICCN